MAEIRDAGLRVVLDDQTADVHHLPAVAALRGNALAADLVGRRSFARGRAGGPVAAGSTEIDAERRRAMAPRARDQRRDQLDPDALLRRLEAVDREAGQRGVDFLTLRRVALLLGLSGAGLEELRGELVRLHHPQYSPPVWIVDRRG